MPDVFSKRKRSEVMSRIRATGTKIEDVLFQAVLDALGSTSDITRNVRTLPGNPDVVIPALKVAIFADGCFYHGCPVHGRIPSSNVAYWRPKLASNMARDLKNRRLLRRQGFSVWRFWEHDLEGRRVERTRRIIGGRLERRVPAS